MSESLRETILDWQAETQIEHETRTIKNVALAGMASQNGYVYTETALREAAPLYERVPVFLDHPASVRQPRDRSTRDLAGRVRNVRFENNRLRGELQIFNTEAGRILFALAESEGPGVGMSHVVLAKRSNDGATVEKILEVISVDAVAFPATTKTFREGTNRPQTKKRPACPRRDLAGANEAPPLRATLPGSLERLLTALDRRLPRHIEQLAATHGLPCPGRGRRVALFPQYIVVEWTCDGFPPRQRAISWRLEKRGIRLGRRLRTVEAMEERQSHWRGRVGTAILERSSKLKPTSTVRHAITPSTINDAHFIETIRRH